MLTERDLQELLDFKAQKPVLSVYLNTDPTLGSADVYKLKLRSKLNAIDLPGDEDISEDKEIIERFFDHEYDWSGRSIAVFSCSVENFFRVYPIAVPVRTRVRIHTRPHVKPLVDLMDSYGGYGVALVDKQGVRVFSFHMGALQEQKGYLGEDIRRAKHGGGSQSAGRRGGDTGQIYHTEGSTDRNMKEAANFAAEFFTEKNIRRVLIGGTDDNIASFRKELPKSWQSLIVGVFPMSMTATHADVMAKALEIGQEAEHQRDERILKTVISGAAKGSGGVTGLEETLRIVHEGRVKTLLISEGFRAPGYRCTGCGFVTAQSLESCPFCESDFSDIPDAVELAVRKVLQDGGEVEVLHQHPELEKHGNIGAQLRY